MSNNRIDKVVSDMVEGVRKAIKDNDVTFAEYRQAVKFMMGVCEAKELPLLIDVFFNISICESENKKYKGSLMDLEGPYYKPDSPFVDGEIKTMEEFDGDPMLIQGRVTDLDDQPVEDVVIDIWQSTPDGKYSGFHDHIPIEYYRGKVRTNENGEYHVRSTIPVPYQIPNKGPTGALLEMMGRHSWRPAHIHFKTHKEGYRQVINQAYFEGGDYVDDDSCSGLSEQGNMVIPEKIVDGVRIMDVDFVLDHQA